LLGLDLNGLTLGIVGMGRIGLAVAKRLHFGWDMKVVYCSRSPKPEAEVAVGATRLEAEELLRSADIVSLHADYNASTHHFINSRTLRLMKPTALLINTARGGLVDQEALYDALHNEMIWGAGLDVTDPEPLPDSSRLRELPRCVIVPHIGSATYKTRQAMADIAVDNLLAGVNGQELLHRVV
jgi:glyoxylate reductase